MFIPCNSAKGRNQNVPPSCCFFKAANRQQRSLLPLAGEETEVVLYQQQPGHALCLSLIDTELTRNSLRIRESAVPQSFSSALIACCFLHRLQEGV